MNKFFYSRLALTNIKKNKNIYFPYLLAGTLIVMLFYILSSITIMVAGSNMKGNYAIGSILGFSTVICGIISLVILFYINSFIMRLKADTKRLAVANSRLIPKDSPQAARTAGAI